MAENKLGFKRNQVWTIIIVLIVIVLIGNLFGCSESYMEPAKTESTTIDMVDKPTDKEFKIFNYYDNLLLEETEKLYDAQDAGLLYKYADEYELEEEVGKEVANKYGIPKEELDNIYIKVLNYKMK